MRNRLRYRRIYGITGVFQNMGKGISSWFRNTFPRKAPGRPWYTSRRMWFFVAIAAIAAVVLLLVFLNMGTAPEKPSQTEPAAAAETEENASGTSEVSFMANGYVGDDVAQVQERLTELGYLDADEPTDTYGSAMEQAVMRFQILEGMTPNGCVDEDVWKRMQASDAPESAIAEGMEGDDVESYQERLMNLGYLASNATGYFGTDTKDAVKEFQEKNGLTASGVIDFDTSEKLYSEDVTPKFLSYGMKNDAVKEMQQKLINLGYLAGSADGDYGERTTTAVKLFQQKNGLVVDGYLGQETKSVLMSEDAQPNAFTVGDKGEAVTQLQERLVRLNYISKATGYFGSDTQEAVKNFQRANDLDVDGRAGKMTLTALYADDVVKGKNPVDVGKSTAISEFIDKAYSKLGCRYVLGAKGPKKFDCSGLVYWCLNQAGIHQSYVTSTTWRTVGNYKTIKDIDDVRAGDILCFSPHHVGIAISKSTMIDASSHNGKVVKRTFRSSYFERHFVCARRVW